MVSGPGGSTPGRAWSLLQQGGRPSAGSSRGWKVGIRRRAQVTLLSGLALALLATPGVAGKRKSSKARVEKLDGYAEWRIGGCLICDGQKVCPARGCKFKGARQVKSTASIPLGSEMKAKGTRLANGTLLATEIEAKPNGSALFEGEIKAATDAAEAGARRSGRFYQDAANQRGEVGRLHESGRYVARVRRIVNSLLPPYLRPADVRVYAIENREWNAFAMGNYSIYVFTGFLDDMDDDEVAIVIGHELVHATHEHSRKQFKRQMWVQLAALGVLAASSEIDNEKKRAVVELAAALTASAYSNGYGRTMEDQADRVGLRYAYEAGYDITKGPRLWQRFAQKYGEGNKIANFFFSEHSQSLARKKKLESEIARNYPDGPKGRASRRTTRPRAAAAASTRGSENAPVGRSRTLAAGVPSTDTGWENEIMPGMTEAEVRAMLGAPRTISSVGGKTHWSYADLSVIFEQGEVVAVKF